MGAGGPHHGLHQLMASSSLHCHRLVTEDSERCLELFQRNKKDSFMRYVTMDETWIHHYTPESNRQSAEWTAKDENRKISAGQVLASVFWDAHGILFIDYLEKGRTINCKYYMALLVRLKREIAKNDLK